MPRLFDYPETVIRNFNFPNSDWRFSEIFYINPTFRLVCEDKRYSIVLCEAFHAYWNVYRLKR